MKIDATWSDPVPLLKDKRGKLSYHVNSEQLPTEPGVYIFCRKFGKKITPIYVGEALSIRLRINNHLKSLPLMRTIDEAAAGKKFIIYCTVKARAKAKAKQQIQIIEKALILHIQSEGHVLFNQKGTKLPTDEINFIGNRTSEAIAPRLMLVKRALTKNPAAKAKKQS
jgi:hypothetical protein